MSTKTGPAGHQDWPAMEADYWQNTKKARDREDAKLAHEHVSRQDELDQGIMDLVDKKAHLQNAMREVDAGIEFRKAEKQRLSHEYEAKRSLLLSQRQDEDRSQQGWFARARESSFPGKENARPKHNDRSPNYETSLPNPAGGWTSINGSLGRNSRDTQDQPPSHPGDLFGSVFHNPVREDETPSSHAIPFRDSYPQPQPDACVNSTAEKYIRATESNATVRAGERPLKPKQDRHSLPGFPIQSRFPTVSNESPEGNRKSPHSRKSLPSAQDSVLPMDSPAPEAATTDDQEITRNCLVLKDNGSIIVEPPMFAGVPLEKIDERHPFWNPEWEPLENTIQRQLDKWKEKLEDLRRRPDSVRHTVFLANRQVNRGQTVLDFLKDGCFHPFQFASRDMMDKSYKTFINYDTVFRLVNVHEELKKFDLEVTSLEWLRQRMYEIAMAQGDKFNLSKTTHDLYHDAKLKFLREKHGFGNIGRPSGYKVGDKDSTKGAIKSKAKKELTGPPGEGRRRSRRTIDQFESDDRPQGPPIGPTDYLEPVTPRLQKRQRLDAAEARREDNLATRVPELAVADLEFDGYSSRDSFSNGRITYSDFRVYQIKTKTLTTRPDVTQYWTWKPDGNKFEHQVLRDVHPDITWGVYQKPNSFDCCVEDIREVYYALDSQKVLIAIADENRGNIVVFFKRERTKKRFLSFIRKKNVKIVKSTHTHLEEAWDAMKSEMMSDGEAEV
ncbi:hypothetical protein F5Y19DRAFT_466707 [Xylariaceae sp. FL1651]|nr:hypothetical protein F5Y19DRAFT_466707 [Xylariaceae sp. FL1651]